MKKHLLPLLLALCLALSLLPAAALAASEEPTANDEPAPVALDAADPEETAADEEECADEEASADDVVTTSESDRAADEPVTLSLDGGTDTHSHPICGASCSHSGSGSHTSVTWQAWTYNDRLPSTAGRFYLTQDVTLNSGSWVVEEDIALCLNGHSITAKGNDPVINVNSNPSYSGTLTLTDCATAQGKITHTSGQNGIGVTVYGTLNMYGGSITGNTASYGGVYVDKPGSFNLYGGIIANNTATYGGGGGVTVAEKSNFIMYGGSITNNATTKLGGGVCVKGNFTMYGGSIENNTATNAGGGVNIDDGTFSMLGGSVTGNTAKYGGGVYSAGNFYLSGSPTISENTITTDGCGKNVYLGLYCPISILKSLSNTTKIGLYSEAMDDSDTPYVDVLPGWDVEDRGSASQYFYSEREDYTLSDDGSLVKDSYEISLTPTSHAFTAATEGYGAQTPVTVTVTNTGNQPTGALTVSVTGSDFTLDKTSIGSIESANGTASFTVVPVTGLDVGTHTATVKVEGGNGISASFTVSFTVNHTGGTATCEAQAVCDVCGKPYGELKEHDIRHVEAKEATTEAAGNIEYWRCAACKTCFADALGKEEIKAADTVIEKLTPSTTPTEAPSSGASPAPTATPAPTTAPSATSAPSAKPEQQTPKTGDEANLALWLVLATVSMTAIALVARKKAK